jgi:hypothetical protein
MAERRMFAKTIVDSDAFLDMPQSSQLLYFHLSMRADDDGFINNPKAIMRNCHCSEDDLKLLALKKFIIPFESGVVVIKHWKIHNYIAKDRYKETKYKEEKATLMLDENNSYTTCIQPVYELETQDRLGKDRLGKDSIDEYNMCDPDESHEKKPSKSEIDRFFEGLWSIYPVKKGKGQVSDSKRKALYEIGEAEMHRAVHRYLTELKKDASWRKPQNGSTFFNSGYVDYLDKNFEPQAVQPTVQQNKTAAMLDESYDMMDAWAKATEGMN